MRMANKDFMVEAEGIHDHRHMSTKTCSNSHLDSQHVIL